MKLIFQFGSYEYDEPRVSFRTKTMFELFKTRPKRISINFNYCMYKEQVELLDSEIIITKKIACSLPKFGQLSRYLNDWKTYKQTSCNR